jgi:hypothetical protein
MPIGKNILAKFGVFGELLGFLWKRKLWWMIPIIVILILLGFLIIFSQSSAVAPFIYSIF